jgi:hypothetical protein
MNLCPHFVGRERVRRVCVCVCVCVLMMCMSVSLTRAQVLISAPGDIEVHRGFDNVGSRVGFDVAFN